MSTFCAIIFVQDWSEILKNERELGRKVDAIIDTLLTIADCENVGELLPLAAIWHVLREPLSAPETARKEMVLIV